MKYKKLIIIGIILLAIGLILSALFNSTYAFFSGDTYADRPEDYSTGTLSVEAVSKTENISLTSALPMTDDEGKETTPYVFAIKNTGNLDYKFDVKLLSTGDSTTSFSSQYIKVQIDDGDVTTLADLTNSVIKSDLLLAAGESIDISVRVWLSIDTPNTEIGKTFNSSIVTDGEAIYTSYVTPLSDFQYYLSNENSASSSIEYIDDDGNTRNVMLDVDLYENEVLLLKYMGDSDTVVVPDYYIVDGVTYNVTLLSYYVPYITDVNDTWSFGVFIDNNIIKSVVLGDNISIVAEDEANVFNLISERNYAYYLFYNCSNLIDVPKIPSSVTFMASAFEECPNLTGTIRINSSNVSDFSNAFSDTTKNITVEVPAGSTTYNTITAAGVPSNITISTY